MSKNTNKPKAPVPGPTDGSGAPSDTAGSTENATVTVPGLRIRTVPETFCRAGRQWGRQAQDVPVSEFTEAQIKALCEEPNLVVVDVDIDIPENEA